MWKDELKLIQCQYLFYWGACSRQTFRCLDPVAEYNSVSQTWKLQNENGHNLDLEYIIYIYIYTHIYIYIIYVYTAHPHYALISGDQSPSIG